MCKVSVIVPVYNVSLYIERCARSLLEQSLEDMEFIFVDDCSPDDSMAILKSVIAEYPARTTRIEVHTENKGLTAARNTGLEVATGEFIAYCDSDDWVSARMYEDLYKEACATDADIVLCDFYMVYQNSMRVYKTMSVSSDKRDWLRDYIATDWAVIWNMIARRRLFVKYALKSPLNITYTEDFYLSVRLFYYASKISKINQPLYYYNRMNASSIMHSLNKKAEEDERFCYLDTIDFLQKKGVLTECEKEMSWRILKNKQDMVLHPDRYQDFLSIYPASHKYIASCPYCNLKVKIMMWMLTHHLRLCVVGINRVRGILNR